MHSKIDQKQKTSCSKKRNALQNTLPQHSCVNPRNARTENKIFWIPPQKMMYKRAGTTGGSENTTMRKAEKIEGNCKQCGYKFKPEDLEFVGIHGAILMNEAKK